MKTIVKILIVVTELAIRCRAGLPRQSFEHFNDHLDGLSFLTSDHPQPNLASSHRTSTSTPTSESLSRLKGLARIDLNRVPSPHDIDSSPMEIDSPLMEIDSPLMEIDSPLMEIDPPPMELGAAAYHIPMNEKEIPEYQLVFCQDVFLPPLYDGQLFEDVWQVILEAMEHTSGGGQLPVLVVSSDAPDFIKKFNYFSRLKKVDGLNKSPKIADIAARQVSSCLANSRTWRAVYQRRLGIDFNSAEKRFQDLVQYESRYVHKIFSETINGWFLIYIILVDMIITILPNGNHITQPVNRIQSFQTAVRCFEDYTRLTLDSHEGFRHGSTKMRSAIIWRFLTYWKKNDENYAWLHFASQGYAAVSWKTFFNFIFSYSIDRFTKKFEIALHSKASH